MVAPYRLALGAKAPTQQSPTTCGAACATVARMMVDPVFARWITDGEGSPILGAEGSTLQQRFASWEASVRTRTNSWRRSGGGVDLPWPLALGTPPWGLRDELEHGGSAPGTRYEMRVLRHLDAPGRRALHADLLTRLREGQPAAFYVGNTRLPRHVTLILPGGRTSLPVYEPARGRVEEVTAERLAGPLQLAGWDVPWLIVQPTGEARAPWATRARALLPRVARADTPWTARDQPDAQA